MPWPEYDGKDSWENDTSAAALKELFDADEWFDA